MVASASKLDPEVRLARTALASYRKGEDRRQDFLRLGWTQSTTIRQKDGFTATLLADPGYLCICFSGTDEPRDWLVNLDITMVEASDDVWVHRGFFQSFAVSADAIRKWVDQYIGDRQIILIGHSLGGALATLCAPYLRASGYTVSAIRTYGSPRVGDRAFAKEYDEHFADRTLRYVNQTDPVPQIPWRWGRYRHVNRVRWSDGSWWRGRVLLLRWLATLIFTRKQLFADSFQDHPMLFYATDIEGLPRPETAQE